MPIPSGVTKVVISGSLPSGEIWQTAYWATGYAQSDITDATTATLAASSSFVALMNAVKAANGTTTLITALDRYHYSGGSAADAHGHAALSYAGSGVSNFHPNQVAGVTTLRTATAGRSSRGRMYWPMTSATIANTGFFAGGQLDAITDALAAHFTSLATGTFHAVVVSQTRNTTYPIISVDNDEVPDTQRRRANKLHTPRHSATV